MGDSGSRRSTLVSRLPLFRRSISRRQDSLPSSPLSDYTVGIHSSSPSSTNSSSDSAGKRRSIFRTPSISFHHKKESERKSDLPAQNSISNGAQSTGTSIQKLNLEQPGKTKGRHSISFSGSRCKKITRSATEDFDKRKEHSSNRNVFTNCISSENDGDDSGYAEEPNQRSVKHSTRKLLPKSFSSHHRFSKSGSQNQSVSVVQQSECSLEAHKHVESELAIVESSLSCSAETTECATSSLLSPLPSTDHTSAPQTPSECLLFIDDSISETDVLPNSGSTQLHTEDFGHNVFTSQIVLNSAAAPDHTKSSLEQSTNISPCHVSTTENQRWEPLSPRRDCTLSKTLATYQGQVLLPISEIPAADASCIGGGIPIDASTESFALYTEKYVETPENSPKKQEFSEDHTLKKMVEQMTKPHNIRESRINSFSDEPQPLIAHHGHYSRVNYASSLSPFREGRHVERRLRSSSEGTAGSSRMALKPKGGNPDDLNSLRKQRTCSTSSKMSSMDVLNNLGSCELDEDDLMLDLEFLEDKQSHRSVCREDSYQSIVSCSSIVFSSVEQPAEAKKNDEELRMPEVAKKSRCPCPQRAFPVMSSIPAIPPGVPLVDCGDMGSEGSTQRNHPPLVSGVLGRNFSLHLSKDTDQGEAKCPGASQVATSPSMEWPFASLEDSVGLESLPFRLMMQDCTSVKTLLLKMKRLLQESADMSPGSSNTSLPISPIAEKPFPFKDAVKDECSILKLQLKERDELIFQLREELEKSQHTQKPFAYRLDKSTQTEFVGHDALWNSASTEGSIYKAIRPVHCFQHYQINTNIWTQDAFH